MRKGVAIVLTLPGKPKEAEDTKIVFQRRDASAPGAAGKLGLWGGDVEPGDKSWFGAAMRETGEENGVDRDKVRWQKVGSFLIPAPSGNPDNDLLLVAFRGIIPDRVFPVYEGVGAEVIPLREALRSPQEFSAVGNLVLPSLAATSHLNAA